MHIISRKSEIHTCECSKKFIFIQAEIDMNYVREKCFWCIPYQHNGVTPKLTHNYAPHTMLDENAMDYVKMMKFLI